MISFQKHIWLPTITGTKEVVVAAESSPETEEGIMKFRETNKEEYKRNYCCPLKLKHTSNPYPQCR